jgi:hypothetical protein
MHRPILSILVLLALAGPAGADVEPGRDKAPDAQGAGTESAPAERESVNPLPPIIDLMKRTERRLAECDAGEETRAAQARIVEALDLGRRAEDALAKLIESIEAHSGGS